MASNILRSVVEAFPQKNLRFAFAYGADAVYAGQPRYSLRVRNNEFSKPNILGKGIEEAHAAGKLFFLASNIAPHNNKLKSYIRDLVPIIDMGPDALIMSDPGLIMMVRERWPDQVVHLSVQSNVVNYAAVKFWQNMGLKRIILSRELSLDEVAEKAGVAEPAPQRRQEYDGSRVVAGQWHAFGSDLSVRYDCAEADDGNGIGF